MTHDEELIERVANAFVEVVPSDDLRVYARSAVATVRTWDREQRAKIDAAIAPRTDPDDYSEWPGSLTEAVRFRGGLTEGKP